MQGNPLERGKYICDRKHRQPRTQADFSPACDVLVRLDVVRVRVRDEGERTGVLRVEPEIDVRQVDASMELHRHGRRWERVEITI